MTVSDHPVATSLVRLRPVRHRAGSAPLHGGGSVPVPQATAAVLDGLAVGLAAQFVLLAALSATVGLGLAGWLAGSAYAVVTWLLLGYGMRRSGVPTLGAANQVTLARAILVGGVTALVAASFRSPVPVGLLVAVAAVALALDWVDGQVARRTGTTSALGARFDMEVDAFLILVLSGYLAQSLGAWVLAIGALRYVFVAAARALPWLRAALPHRFSRKTVAAMQGIVLAVASSGVLPGTLAYASVGLALALLSWSFGRDVGWLWRARHRYPAPVGSR
ncbi:CDP-alcohol phosphatidyltransferase family protein [Plantactinospora sp. WMMB782]|uniref:CDP-alcohol phosphatidyltransferase family protein n=1 Tax=Plantactinospora sp. WMMB782 TaxID=3404121 RepID=UPI003B95B64C